MSGIKEFELRNEKDVNKMGNCIKILRACIDICDLYMKFMSRNSNYAEHIYKKCAAKCRKMA